MKSILFLFLVIPRELIFAQTSAYSTSNDISVDSKTPADKASTNEADSSSTSDSSMSNMGKIRTPKGPPVKPRINVTQKNCTSQTGQAQAECNNSTRTK